MRRSLFCLSVLFLFSSTAFAAVCENAAKGAERKAATAKRRCEDKTQVDRLKVRLATAKTDKSKKSIQALITRAEAKQQGFCKQFTETTAAVTKIQEFCKIAGGQNTSECKFGFSLRVKGTDASSRCKRGRMWLAPVPNTRDVPLQCYYVEEFFFTSEKDFGNAKSGGRGEQLYADRPFGTYYQLRSGFLLNTIKKAEDCK